VTGSPRTDPSEPDFGWLAERESVLAALTGDGASLFATEDRVVIVRDGSAFRPRSGIRSWTYDRIQGISLSRPNRGQARMVLRTGQYPWQAVSMFFGAEHWRDAERIVSSISDRLRPGRRRS
jgi:hypothetical protein